MPISSPKPCREVEWSEVENVIATLAQYTQMQSFKRQQHSETIATTTMFSQP
jgi:hypothetical protein